MEKAELEIAQYALKIGMLSQSQFKSVMKWANLCLNFSLDIPLSNIIFEGFHWNWEQKQQYMNLFVDNSEVVHLRSILDPYRMELDENWYNPISSDAFQKNYDRAKSIQTQLLTHNISWKIEHIVRLLQKPSNAISPILTKKSARKIQLQTICERMFDNKLMLPEFSAPKLCQYLISDIETVQSIANEIQDCNIPLIQLLIEKCDIDANLLHLLILSQMYIHDTEIEFQWNYQTWTKLSIPSFLVPALKTIKRNCINFLDKTYSFSWYTFEPEEEKILLEYYKKHINPDFWEHYIQILHVCQQSEFELSPLKILLMMGVLPTSLAFAGVLGYIYKIPSQQILSILQSYNLLPNQTIKKTKEDEEDEKRLYTRKINAPLQRTLAMHQMHRSLISNNKDVISQSSVEEKTVKHYTIETKKIETIESHPEISEKIEAHTETDKKTKTHTETDEKSETHTEIDKKSEVQTEQNEDEKKKMHALKSEGLKTGRFDKNLLRSMMQNYKASEQENEVEENTETEQSELSIIESQQSESKPEQENEVEENTEEKVQIEQSESKAIEQSESKATEQSESKAIEQSESKEKTEEEKQRNALIADGLKTGRFDKNLLRSMMQKFKASKSKEEEQSGSKATETEQKESITTIEQRKSQVRTEEEKQRHALKSEGLKTGRFDKNLLRSMMQKLTASKPSEEESEEESEELEVEIEETEQSESQAEEKQSEAKKAQEEAKKQRHALKSEGLKTGRFDKNMLRSMMQDYKASPNTSESESEPEEENNEFIAPPLDFELPDVQPEQTSTPKVVSIGLTTGRFDRNQLKNLLHEFSRNQDMKIDIETLYFASTNRFEQEEQPESKEPAHIARMKRLLQRSNDKEKFDFNKTMELRIDTNKIKEEETKKLEKKESKKTGYSITISGDVALLQDLYLDHKVKQYDLVTAFFLQQDDEEKQSILEILSQRDFITPEVYQEYKDKKYEPRTLELEKKVNSEELELAQLLLSYNLITRDQLKKLFSIQNTLYSIGIKIPFADIIVQNKIMSVDMIEALIVEHKRRKEEAEEKQRQAQLAATEEKPLVVPPKKAQSLLDTIGLQIPLKNKKKKISWKNLTKGTQIACIVGLVCILFASYRIVPLFFNQSEKKIITRTTESTTEEDKIAKIDIPDTSKQNPIIPAPGGSNPDDSLPPTHIKLDNKNITVATENKVNKILVTLEKHFIKLNANSISIQMHLNSNQKDAVKKYKYTVTLWDSTKKIKIKHCKLLAGLRFNHTIPCDQLIPCYYNLHLELLSSEQENSQVFPLDYNWWLPCSYGSDDEIMQYSKVIKDMIQNLIKKFEKWNNMLEDSELQKSGPKFTAKWKNINNEISVAVMNLKKSLLVHIHKPILTTIDNIYAQYIAHFKDWDEYNEGLSLLPPEPLPQTILQPLQNIYEKFQLEKPSTQTKKKIKKDSKENKRNTTKDNKKDIKDNKANKNSQITENKKK